MNLKTRIERLEQATTLGEPPDHIKDLAKYFGCKVEEFVFNGHWITLEELVSDPADDPDTSGENKAE